MATFIPNRNFQTYYGPSGETARWLKGQARRVEFISKTYVGKGGSGKLAKSIKSGRVTRSGPTDLDVEIYADARKRGEKTSYAEPHHEGSGPHVIQAAPGEVLHWGGARGPTVVAVIHPGSTGTFFLLKALNIVVGGMR